VAGLPNDSTLTGTISFTFNGAANNPGPITVKFKLTTKPENPFGSVDTPTNNRTGVTGAIPFTGWILDDVDVIRVMICRSAFGAEVAPIDPNCGGAAQIFVGFGLFIEGARPDVAAAFPQYPANTRAGWGFMVLTNMLPNRGNGTYTFQVYGQDRDGHTLLMGTRTMTCSNATATLPFGAIDTPTQGGIASGTSFVNFGWALTPNPKSIPIDGSTVTALVDGVGVGTVDYNHFRSDIASLFPGLANSNGAVGFKVIDTTAMTNGLHTIVWVVQDNTGAIEGIGSRFFSVSNSAAVTAADVAAESVRARGSDGIDAIPAESAPLVARRGWDPDAPWRLFGVNAAGRTVIRGEEIDRFELQIGQGEGEQYSGFLRVGTELKPLPVGSNLAADGTFTWAPGVGFVGSYDLVFVRSAGGQTIARRDVRIILAAKGRGSIGSQVEIDSPHGGEVTPPFNVGGWAADLDAGAGTGVETLHVWAFPAEGGTPIFIGVPSYGGHRPDVAAVHGDQFRDSGFDLEVRGLAAGTYDLQVFPWSSVTGSFAVPAVVRVTVK
jgi:hypothetical protein